jgi:N-acylneuraminate cytidylyltransferase
MNIIAIIPARGGSKRIPHKNLFPLAGKPLIVHSIEQAKQSKLVNRVIVSTDDDEIANVSRQYGAEVILRPEELSTDTASSESVLIHVLEYLEKNESFYPDILVFIQCTSPLRRMSDIDNAIGAFLEQKADSLFTGYVFNKFIWDLSNGKLFSLNFDCKKPRWREQDFPLQLQENGSIYVIKPWVLKELKNRFGGKIAFFEMDYLDSFQIDSYEDIELLECIMRLKTGGKGNVQ